MTAPDMTVTGQPPEEVFCMTCGLRAVLLRDRLAGTLRCPRCGHIQHVPALPLFVVTGASGAGKTTVTSIAPTTCSRSGCGPGLPGGPVRSTRASLHHDEPARG